MPEITTLIERNENTLLRVKMDRLRQDAEAFRAAVIQSGALNHVPQSTYFAQLRTLETTLADSRLDR